MRILYFTRGYSPHDHRFLTALSQTGHQIFYLRLENIGRALEDRPVPAEVEQILWSGGKQPVSWLDYPALRNELHGVVRQIQPDLIHAGPIQKSAFLTALTGFHPLVSMSWGSDMLVDAQRDWMWRWSTRFTLRHSDVLIGDCQAVADEAMKFGFSKERIVLFPWGVDLNRFAPGDVGELRQRLGWEDCFVLLSLRSWEPIYGVDHLVRSFAAAAQEIPNLRLLLLGGGSQAAMLRKILIEAGVMERVHFGGQVKQDDLPLYYRASDLYVSASHSDGSSVSLLEAMACGLPVLISDIPGNREWMEQGAQGWQFPDGDECALQTGILQAYRQSARFKQMGQSNRELAEKRADWSKNFQRLLAAYKLAMQERGEHG